MPFSFNFGVGVHSILIPVGPGLPAYLTNFKSSNTQNFKAGINAVKAGTRNAKIMCIGDSLTSGQGSDGTSTGKRVNAYPADLAAKLATRFSISVNTDNIFGCEALTTTTYPTYDPRLTINSAIISSTVLSAGGAIFTSTNNTANIVFTPGNTFDTVEYFLVDKTGNVSLIGDGTETLTVNTTGINASLIHSTKTFTTARSTLTIQGATASGFGCIGVQTRNSATKKLMVQNSGWRGSTTGQWTPSPSSNAYDPFKIVQANAPDLVILNLGTNDMASTALSTFQIQFPRLITQCKQTGTDVIVLIPNYYASSDVDGQASHATLATINSFMDAMRSAAITADIPYVDTPASFGSYANQVSLGHMFDITHLNQAGYLAQSVLIDTAMGYAYSA